MQYSDYKKGDIVVAIEDFVEPDEPYIRKGTQDIVESVSSNHHGGLQLNLVKYGRGWGKVWKKVYSQPDYRERTGDLIPASDAKRYTKKINDNWLVHVKSVLNGRIKSAYDAGDDKFRFDLNGSWLKVDESDYGLYESRVKLLMTALQAVGYEVKRHKDSDQRDNSSWDFLMISW